MKKITAEKLELISKEAKASTRKRKNYNYHEESSDLIQRMLNAIEPDTYVQPHKHENPNKREIFIILKGRVLVITFSNTGTILDHVVLDNNSGNYGVEIPEKVWHSIITLESNSVVYEIKDGPYEPIDDKNFATWAPKEGDTKCSEFNNGILKKLGVI